MTRPTITDFGVRRATGRGAANEMALAMVVID
jgi:hypothetical protein